MARRKSDSPQKAAMREMVQGYLKENDISIKSGRVIKTTEVQFCTLCRK